MTSPRQRKKRLAYLKSIQKNETKPATEHNLVVAEKQVPVQKAQTEKVVAAPTAAVVESEVAAKPKKVKNGLAETKSQDQVVVEQKEEVKTQTKE